MSKKSESTQGSTAIKERQEIKEPSFYKVILLNDDYTSMEFVVHILESVFNKNAAEAHVVMLDVHANGKGIAGVFTKEVAETKVAIVHHLAKQAQFPLKCTLEQI